MQYPGPDTFQNGLAGPLLSAILYGGKCLQYSKLIVADSIKTLADATMDGVGIDGLPSEATYCLIVVEADVSQADAAKVIRFRQDGGDPAADEGMPCGDNGSFEIKGSNLGDFKVIGINAGLSHTLRIEFYGSK